VRRLFFEAVELEVRGCGTVRVGRTPTVLLS
jgi:hypothetical protein